MSTSSRPAADESRLAAFLNDARSPFPFYSPPRETRNDVSDAHHSLRVRFQGVKRTSHTSPPKPIPSYTSIALTWPKSRVLNCPEHSA